MQLNKPYFLSLFSLTFYPETGLYNKARSEGIINDDLNQVYRCSQLTPKHTYLNGVFAVLSANAPKLLITFLLWEPVRRHNPVWLPYTIASFFELLKLINGFFGYVFRGEWKLILFLLRKALSKSKLEFKNNKSQMSGVRFCGGPGEFN